MQNNNEIMYANNDQDFQINMPPTDDYDPIDTFMEQQKELMQQLDMWMIEYF